MRPNVELLRGRIGDMLTDTGTIDYDTGEVIFDEETLEEIPVFATRYTGPLLVQPQYAAPQTFDVAGAQWTITRYDVTLPTDTDVFAGDRLTVNTAAFDDRLAGAQFRITDVRLDSWQIARFVIAER